MEPTIFDETQPKIPRATRPNPFNYTDLQFATRDIAVRDMAKAHPTIPYKWLEWLYDTIENKPKEEVDEIIRTNAWDKKLNPERQLGGIIKGACEILPPPSVGVKGDCPLKEQLELE